MATYYVRTPANGGNDSSAGTSAGTAWATCDKAANTVAAGDTVWIGAGVYRELVTMDTSGSSGNQIVFAADITGANTGDGGLVLISCYDNEQERTVGERAACWNMNGKEFITVRGFTMEGAIGIYDNSLAGNRAYEGAIIEQCALIGASYGIRLTLNNGATPGGSTGLTIRNCAVSSIRIDHTNNASAHTNVKLLIENVIAHGYLAYNTSGITMPVSALDTFSIGGVTIANCTCFGGTYGITLASFKNTTDISYVYNSTAAGNSASITFSGTAAAIEYYSCASLNRSPTPLSGGTAGDIYSTSDKIGGLLGGIADYPLRYYTGWSPWQPFEPIRISNYEPGIVGYANADRYFPTTDAYGNPRGMGRPTQKGHLYYVDGSDDAISDPNSVWTNEANIVDSGLTTSGTVATTGSVSSNYAMAGGTNAPSSGGTIQTVYARFYADTVSSTAEGRVSVSTDGWAEVLGTASLSVTTTDAWSSWASLTTPSGGWTWAKVQALEFRAWRDSGSGTLRIYMIQIGVITDESTPDIGAVENRGQLEQEASVVFAGDYSAKLTTGAGVWETLVPVLAESTTISVQCRYNSSYSGSLPQIKVLNIPGVSDQTDTMTAAADTWEQLSCTFTPTSAGTVRLQLISRDVSASGGIVYFDDMEV